MWFDSITITIVVSCNRLFVRLLVEVGPCSGAVDDVVGLVLDRPVLPLLLLEGPHYLLDNLDVSITAIFNRFVPPALIHTLSARRIRGYPLIGELAPQMLSLDIPPILVHVDVVVDNFWSLI